MIKKLSIAAAALAMTTGALAGTADAQRYGGYNGYNQGYGQSYDRGYRDSYNQGPRYYDGGNYRHVSRRNRCDNTTGTVIGGILGGLLGNSVAGRGDRLLGTVIGGAGGALAGRAVDRSDDPRYCR
jgi:outer membrane lipoprotein SlyB